MNIAHACIGPDYTEYNYHYDSGVITYRGIDNLPTLTIPGSDVNNEFNSVEIYDTYSVVEFLQVQSISLLISLILMSFLIRGIIYMFKYWNSSYTRWRLAAPIVFGFLWCIFYYMYFMLFSSSCGTPNITYTASNLVISSLLNVIQFVPSIYALFTIIYVARFAYKIRKR